MTDPTASSAPLPWERIVADVADALIYIDTEGVIRAWNAAAATLFGFPASEALGQSVDLIIPEHLREAHWRGFNRAMERGATSRGAEVRTTRGLHKDGRKLYVDMSFSVVKSATGQVLGSAAMARDATERYLAERARKAAASGG
ncbi:MAG TPA: PAS domain S-box protein [Ottowia sp.]|uniref:PAS domain-containing protein n=1 Tax=Ottowia sp. TaxID=1898956 RepID=UPI002BA139A4|nr:PAS domain S-box protein [Ottowia sp.]HMN20003.1 PAS domain S-box protein [Ottowia sp.]